MKRITAVLLALALTFTMLSATAEDLLTGEWYLRSMLQDGQTMDVASMGISGTLTLDEDGSAVISMLGEETTGTWTDDQGKITITLEGSPAEAVLADGQLTVSSGSVAMVFSRESVEAIQLAEVKTDAAPEEFDGKWVCRYTSMGPMVVNTDAFLAEGQVLPALTFSDGHMQLENVDAASMFGNEPVEMAFADGTYTYKDARVVMLQDGMLALLINLGEELGYYFIRADEEAPAA